MSLLRSMAGGFRSLFRRERVEAELDEELRGFLEMAAEEKMKQGMNRRDALRAVRLEQGSFEVTKEVVRTSGWESFVDTSWQDLRFAARTLQKSPGFTAVAVLTLALGIGANTAIFSLVDTFLLRVLPVKDPQQLVFIRATRPKGGTHGDFAYRTFEALRGHNNSFSGMFAWDDSRVSAVLNGQAELIDADFVSGDYWDVLGVAAFLGRTFHADDDQPGKNPVAVISYDFWQRRFARDPAAVGKTLYLGRIPFTVIGVTSPRFFGRNVAGRSAEVVLPMAFHPQLGLNDHDTFEIMARLKPGVTAEQARADLDVSYQQILDREAGSSISRQMQQEIAAQKIVLRPSLRGESQPTENFAGEMRILAGVVGIALLIAAVNVASLLLARASARQKEIAMRLALGAGRARLIRQLLTESVLLAGLGGALGLLFANWVGSLLLAVLLGSGSTIPFPLSPDPRVLAFTAGVSLLAGILFGLAPALAYTRVDLNPILKGADGHAGSRATHGRLTKSLVISQVALSFSLLIGAGLLLHTLQQFYAVDTGFEREKVVQGWVFPALEGYDHPKEMRLYREFLEKFNATPGVQSASLSRLRMIFGNWYRDAWVQGAAVDPAEPRQVYCDPVGPRFFATMGIPLLFGREFSDADTETSPKVAIISESLARQFFPKVNPLGRRFGFDSAQSSGDIEVIGVAKDVKHHLEDQRLPESAWIPYTQATTEMYGQMNFLVRTTTAPASVIPALLEQARSVDKSLPLVGVETQEAEVDEYLGDQRSMATLLSFFAALALALATIGLYGTMSYAVGRRTRELGIRFALGAQRGEVLRMVLRETMSLAAIGVAIGVPVALAAARLLSSMLFGVKTTDAATVSTVILVMSATALLAGYLPARRATRIDPIVALRYE
jgi:predicted permease